MLGLALAAVTAHLTVGGLLAARHQPRIWAQARETWGPDHPEDARIEVRAETVGMVLFWPLLLGGKSLLGMFDRACDRSELREFRRQLDNKDRSTP